MRHCYDNNIAIFLLLPHSSHLIQLLDVGVFSPLKAAMKSQLNKIFRTGIARLQKSEWIENYIIARDKGMTKKNILAGWSGSGLWPINSVRILSELPESDITTSPPFQHSPATPELLTSSPPDPQTLHSTNTSLKTKIAATSLPTSIKTHVRRLTGIAEQLYAQNAILHKEIVEIKSVLGARKERESGKRKILKGIRLISTEEVVTAVEQMEVTPQAKKKAQPKRKRKRQELEESEIEKVEGDTKDTEYRSKLQKKEDRSCIVM